MAEIEDFPRTYTEAEIGALLAACAGNRYELRNRVIVLLACEAGLTPKEISRIRRWDILDSKGLLDSKIDIPKSSGYLLPRKIEITPKGRLWTALVRLLKIVPGHPRDPLIISERASDGVSDEAKTDVSPKPPLRATSIGYIFWKLSHRAGVAADGGRTARRTFLVNTARSVKIARGSLREVQKLAGHRNLISTQSVIEAEDAAPELLNQDLFKKIR